MKKPIVAWCNKIRYVSRRQAEFRTLTMKNTFSATLAAMSAEEKVSLLTGCGLWRTASLPQHGINDIVMTDGTYGVRYSTAQIDGDENGARMTSFPSSPKPPTWRKTTSRRKAAVKRCSAPQSPPPAFPMVPVWHAAGTPSWCPKWARRWRVNASKLALASCWGRALISAARRWPDAARNIIRKIRY